MTKLPEQIKLPLNKEGVPTHPSIVDAWEYKKTAMITKECRATRFSGGRASVYILLPGELVHAILYVSVTRKPYYVVKSERLQKLLLIPADAIKIVD